MTRDHPWLDGPLPKPSWMYHTPGINSDGSVSTRTMAETLRHDALAARVRELEAENERLREALLFDDDLPATWNAPEEPKP